MNPEPISSVFISYARKDATVFARRLGNALEKAGFEVYADWYFVGGGEEWAKQIRDDIAKSERVLFITTEASVDSDACHEELDIAQDSGKKIAPIIRDNIGVDDLGNKLEALKRDEEIKKKNFELILRNQWHFIRRSDEMDWDQTNIIDVDNSLIKHDESRDRDPFPERLKKLIQDMTEDPDYARMHTRYLQDAREWEQNDRDSKRLLPENSLAEAEIWLAGASNEDQHPTPLQIEYLVKSRKHINQRYLRISLGFLAVLLVVIIAISIFSVEARKQRNIAEQERNIAEQERSIAEQKRQEAESLVGAYEALQALRQNQPDLALMLAFEAVENPPVPPQAQQVLIEAFYAPGVVQRYEQFNADNTTPLQTLALHINSENPFALTVDVDSLMRIWDFNSEEFEWTFPQSEAIILSAAISSDGQKIATGDTDGIVSIYSDSNLEASLDSGDGFNIISLAFSPTNDLIAAGNERGQVIVWNLQNQEQLASIITIHDVSVNDLAFNQTGTLLASASSDNTIALWQIDDMSVRLVNRFVEHEDIVNVVDWVDENIIVSGSRDKTLILWNIEESTFQRLIGHRDEVISITVAPERNRILSSARDNHMIMWDARAGNILWSPRVPNTIHNDSIFELVFDEDGNEAYSISTIDRSLARWSVVDRSALGRINPPQDVLVRNISFSADYETFLTVGSRGNENVWLRNKSGTVLLRFGTNDDLRFSEATISPDASVVMTGERDGTVRLWNSDKLDAERGNLIYIMGSEEIGHTDIVNSIDFNSDGSLAVSTSDDGSVIVWDVATGMIIEKFIQHEDKLSQAQFVEGTSDIISADISGQFYRWNSNTGEIVNTFNDSHNEQLTLMEVSPDGQSIVSTGTSNWILFWNTDGSLIGQPTPNTDRITSFAMNDNNQLVSGSNAGKIALWDIPSQQVLYIYGNRRSEYSALAFVIDPDGDQYILSSENGNLSRWAVPDIQEVIDSLSQGLED